MGGLTDDFKGLLKKGCLRGGFGALKAGFRAQKGG